MGVGRALSQHPQSAVGPREGAVGVGDSGGGTPGAAGDADTTVRGPRMQLAARHAARHQARAAAAQRCMAPHKRMHRMLHAPPPCTPPPATQQDGARAVPARARGSGAFRFWHDERRFKGPGDKCVVQQVRACACAPACTWKQPPAASLVSTAVGVTRRAQSQDHDPRPAAAPAMHTPAAAGRCAARPPPPSPPHALQALFDAGGVRTGGHPKCAPLPGPLGFQRPSDWDLLWSPARTALKALPAVKPGQLVSALPGMMSVTKKVGGVSVCEGGREPGWVGASAATPAGRAVAGCGDQWPVGTAGTSSAPRVHTTLRSGGAAPPPPT